jgi:hypothetical protein
MMAQRLNQTVLIAITIVLAISAVCLILFGAPRVSGQATGKKWNPRRTPVGTQFIGDQACGECHKKAFAAHPTSGMAMAMEPIAESRVLSAHPQLSMTVGQYTYEIKRQGKQSFYSVTDGKDTMSLPIAYAFGQGKMGQTYVLERNGKFYESLVSFYSDIKGLDFTVGAPRGIPPSLDAAFGRQLNENEVRSCFSCHSNNATSGSQLQLEKLTHGVRCETCHGPGKEHLDAVKAGEPGYKSVFNPGRLSGEELTQQFCASCHRGVEEFSLLQSMGRDNVRFQPYRIFHSKCYSDDRNISCVACHNPHEPLQENAAFYDAKCSQCHAVKNKPAGPGKLASCPVADKDCTSFHMPKVEIKAAHFKFTDHFIRIVKPGEVFPR